MRFLKLALISVVVFALILTAFSLLLPSTINISKAIDINAPLDKVYPNISDLSNWRNWYADSASAVVSSPSSGKGASVKISKTSIRINEADSALIRATWQSGNNEPLNGSFNFFKDTLSGFTTVQWHFVQHTQWYPWEKLASIVSNKSIAPFMEKSLDNLKATVERKK